MGRKKKKQKKLLTFHLLPRGRNQTNNFFWEPEGIKSQQQYDNLIDMLGPDNVDLLPEQWRPEDFVDKSEKQKYDPEADKAEIEKYFGDILREGEYDEFVVEEISDDGEEDGMFVEENVSAPTEKATKFEPREQVVMFREPGFENHVSVFAYDQLTEREEVEVLTKLSKEPMKKHFKKDNDDLMEVMAALDNPEGFEDANEDWLGAFDEDEDFLDYQNNSVSNHEANYEYMEEELIDKPISEKPVDDFEMEVDSDEVDMNMFVSPPKEEDEEGKQDESFSEENKKPCALESQLENLLNQDDEEIMNKFVIPLNGDTLDNTNMYMLNEIAVEERFEAMVDQFDDENIGELDDEEIDAEGGVEINRYAYLYDNFIEKNKRDWGKYDQKVKDHIVSYIENYIEPTEDETLIEIDRLTYRPERDKWDCQSIISTYSNTENHPRRISIKTNKKKKINLSSQGIPLKPVAEEVHEGNDGVFIEYNEEGDSSEEDQKAVDFVPIIHMKRNRDETKEEKKRRKQLVKQQRKLARKRKKEMKRAFSKENQSLDSQKIRMASSFGAANKI